MKLCTSIRVLELRDDEVTDCEVLDHRMVTDDYPVESKPIKIGSVLQLLSPMPVKPPEHCYEPVPYLATEEYRHDVHTRQLEQVGWFAWDGRFYPLGDQPLGGRATMGFAPCYVEIGDE